MIEVREATESDIDDLVRLEVSLFEEDAGEHEPRTDLAWPRREGQQDFEKLLASPESVVLVGCTSAGPIGHLVGYTVPASPTRQPGRYGILRSMYVAPDGRRLGTASLLAERFLDWARTQGCVEVQVNHYSANTGAGHLYERLGFTERSVSRVRPL